VDVPPAPLAARRILLAASAALLLGGCPAAEPDRPAAPTGRPALPGSAAAWEGAAACSAAPDPGRGPLGVGTWNLRWFPDGGPDGPGARATDVDWMACAIASLGVDVLAVQEVLLHRRGRAAVARLRALLDAQTHGRWQARFDGCPRDGGVQHVGVLWNAARATLRAHRDLPSVNPTGRPCGGHLRPGFLADFDVGGRPLRVLTVHLDSGRDPRDRRHRAASVRALAAEATDRRLLVLGDFNAMGQSGGPARDRERAAMESTLGAAGLRRLVPSPDCTEFYRGRASPLDLAFASADLPASAEVAGPCASFACRLPRGVRPPALERLSDHCPLVVRVP
jgi:endonuclease/exonuclease/phosphatase family metal-dependent hydrolase